MGVSLNLSVFKRGEFYFCAGIEHVREVIQVDKIIPSPKKILGLQGFVDFREIICPIFDVTAILSGQEVEHGQERYTIIVLEAEGHLFAIQIDRFVESITPSDEIIAQIQETSKLETEIIQNSFRASNTVYHLLNLKYLKELLASKHENLVQEGKTHEKLEGPTTKDEEIEMICFTIEGMRFAIPIADIVEVIEGYRVEPLFQVNPFLRGLINLRGQIIACVDISMSIGLEARVMGERSQHILLQNQEQDLALCIDSVSKKRKFLKKEIASADHIFTNEFGSYLLGVIEEPNDRLLILSGSKIFESKDLAAYLD